ncbi:PBSX family phage terminase large subunit [Youxingia wuxianensis]|uniref:PBSX family phage terminase large subunit n=1 Tax=Youxingia wuxianensis TaxID=2763678 RepID=A0A926EPE0_9FIRM|nr:PBSX family phage terminase large subunit [Youxingia wuxianensis]MBC8585321.1 PBSX family phage terminase large subunit [Youxingia wuxianensis]
MPNFVPFSEKQLKAMTWWCPQSPDHDKDAIICDGAVRSGKTLCMSVGFVSWAMASFQEQAFAMCGKTVLSLRRNVVSPLLPILSELGFSCRENLSRGYIEVSVEGRKNRFYLFGGRDESSAALIQGVTLAGVLFDEVALMPRSFVEQALARCSVNGSKFWFNCNPQHPQHWFYTQWILKASQKNALVLHFVMEDNPSLSKKMLRRYQSLYSGSFYDRFVLGKWTCVQGAVYPMFDEKIHVVDSIPSCSRYYISCDYGTINPASFGLWGESDGRWYRIREYYHSSRLTGDLKTDEEYYEALDRLAGEYPVQAVVVDPSAVSFMECIRRRGKYQVLAANNDVSDGIRTVSSLLKQGQLLFSRDCKDILREFSLYRWDENAGHDCPRKENDHAMDDLRYFVMTVARQNSCGFCSLAVER